MFNLKYTELYRKSGAYAALWQTLVHSPPDPRHILKFRNNKLWYRASNPLQNTENFRKCCECEWTGHNINICKFFFFVPYQVKSLYVKMNQPLKIQQSIEMHLRKPKHFHLTQKTLNN